jgi:hypothetical protein
LIYFYDIETKVIIRDGIANGGKTLRAHFEAVGSTKAYNKYK